MNAPLILLASYPKSGNTWVRALLTSLLREDGEVSIDDLEGRTHLNDFPEDCPWPLLQMNAEEQEWWWSGHFGQVARHAPTPSLLKTHAYARKTPSGEWLFPHEAVRAAVHVVRHPVDVLPSLANHMGLDEGLALRCFKQDGYASGLAERQTSKERWGSWEEHTRAWMRRDLPYRTIRLRFEDLKRDTLGELRRLCDFLGWECKEERLVRAVEMARFDRLQSQEKLQGFKERPLSSKTFFRSGNSSTDIAREVRLREMELRDSTHALIRELYP